MNDLSIRGDSLSWIFTVLFFLGLVFCFRDDRQHRYERDDRDRLMPWRRERRDADQRAQPVDCHNDATEARRIGQEHERNRADDTHAGTDVHPPEPPEEPAGPSGTLSG